MGKRKYVESKLHTELSEYSSLLRALRTSTTLDLSTQLTLQDAPGTEPTAAPDGSVYEDDDEDDEGEAPVDLNLDETEEAGPSSSRAVTSHDQEQIPVPAPEESGPEPASVAPTRRRLRSKARAPATVRDTWTKWPLVPSEVHVPEWPFDEEVRVLALDSLHQLRAKNTFTGEMGQETAAAGASSSKETSESITAPADNIDLDATFDNKLTPVNVHAMSRATSWRLYEILAASAALLPEAEDSLQNRHGYINWELVLSAVDAFGLYTPECASFKLAFMTPY